MQRRLPKGEETLPIIEIERRFLTLQELKTQYPMLYQQLVRGIVRKLRISDQLLIERVRLRHTQGRVPTIYRLITEEVKELRPENQIREMEQKTQIGLELIEAERKLLDEELMILRGLR